MTTINIPFSGFYNSLWSDIVDSEVESFGEYENERQESREYYPETYQPEPLRVDVSQFAWEFVNYSTAHLQIAQAYVDAFGEWLDEKAKELCKNAPKCELKFQGLDSPREYNFRSDEIDCEVSPAFVRFMYRIATRAPGSCAEPLADAIRRRHSSRDGFISFYSNRPEEWARKPLAEWDLHELRTLLESVFGEPEALGDIYYRVTDGETGYRAFSDAMNWKAFDEKVTETRAEQLAEWIDSEPEKAGAWIAHNPEAAAPIVAILPSDLTLPDMPYRCTKTPDFFGASA